MKEMTDIVAGAFNQLVDMPTVLLVGPMMIVLGWLLKRSAFPNRFIPLVVVPLPSILMFFLLPFDPGQMTPGITNPGNEFIIRCIGIGLVIGFVTWGMHKAVLGKLEKYLPGFDAGDTTVIEKPKDP